MEWVPGGLGIGLDPLSPDPDLLQTPSSGTPLLKIVCLNRHIFFLHFDDPLPLNADLNWPKTAL